MVSTQCAFSELQSGALREEVELSTVVESIVGCRNTRKRTVAGSIGRVNTRFGEGGGQLDR